MRLGFDLDGCLAAFCDYYEKLIVGVTGKDLFPKDKEYRTVWDYPQEVCGYGKSEIKAVWKHHITKSDTFWASIPAMEGTAETIAVLNHLVLTGEHEVYFITDRFGVMPKLQTEAWLHGLGMVLPTVLLASDKATAMDILKLDAYVDDKLSHCNNCMFKVRYSNSPSRVYLVDAPYNQGPELDLEKGADPQLLRTHRDPGLKVVGSVAEMLVLEGVWPVVAEEGVDADRPQVGNAQSVDILN